MKGNNQHKSASRAPRSVRYNRLDDRELIDRAITGEANAQQEFAVRFRKFLYRLLQENGLKPDEQEDLVSDIFLHLMERDCYRLRQWKGSEQFLSWLRCVVRNLVADHRRQPELRRLIPLEDAEHALTDYDEAAQMRQIHAAQQADAVLLAMCRMSALDAELIIRGCHWEQSYRDMAADCRMTVGHLGVAFHRAKNRLRRSLQRDFPNLFSE